MRTTISSFRKCGLRKCGQSLLFMALLVFAVLPPSAVMAQVRLKDIVDFEGIRENQLVGYGLVVGLNGTGDSLGSAPFTEKSLIGMLERLGVNTRGDSLSTQNVAAVIVTASLPPFLTPGARIDVTVSTLGDAESLLGGTLLVTPLLGADGEVYAIGQGSVAIGGFSAEGQGQSVTSGVPTSGRIANGATVERATNFALSDLGVMHLTLRNPDFTTAQRISDAINTAFPGLANARDPSTIMLRIPDADRNNMVALLTKVEQITVNPDQVARVVIDEQSGTIVMGQNVRISEVAIAQGNLTIRITETPQVSQPSPLSEGGETVVVPRTNIEVEQNADAKLAVLTSGGVSLQELVQGLNALGIGPRDMITILQSIKSAGALQADIEVM